MCNTSQGSDLVELIIQTTLIIWDEALMTHRYCFEALDRTLRDIMRFKDPDSSNKPFGGKVVVLRGDFRQILPVIPGGTRQDIIMSSINSSYLWDSCKVLNLTKNMRLQSGTSEFEVEQIDAFSKWILCIGDGMVRTNITDDQFQVEMPIDILVPKANDHVMAIADAIYGQLLEKHGDENYFRDRAILAPTLDDVQGVNEFLIDRLPGEEKIYLSSDSICKHDDNAEMLAQLYPTEVLNSIKGSGLPNHIIKLKVGAPVMLLRNIDKSLGLCNGTRLTVS